jgi:hypothetical protein
MVRHQRLLPAVGAFVRYLETTTRWYFAVVRAAESDEIAIELFWGERMRVPAEQVQPVADLMASRTRSLSMNRSQLCQRFFGQDLLNLRQDRLKRMQSILRKHGYLFDPPARWPSPATRVRIWADRSVVGGPVRPRDRGFEALLPRWLEPQRMPAGSRDPLGLQAYAERVADKLLPGLTVATVRIGYYAFLCWAIERVNERALSRRVARREMLNRLERAFVLCEFVHHGREDDGCRLLGRRSRTQVLQSVEGGTYRVPQRIMKNQSTAGALAAYGTSLTHMGFVEESLDQASDCKLEWATTETGRELARAFARRVPDGFEDFAFADGAKRRDSIRSWGREICFSRLRTLQSLREVFLDGFLNGNSDGAATRFATVRRLFRRRLLTGTYRAAWGHSRRDAAGEDDLDLDEESDQLQGLTNDAVLIRFLKEQPSVDNVGCQEAAVYEFICLGLSAIFRHVVVRLENEGAVRIAALRDQLAKESGYARIWKRSHREAAQRARPVPALVEALFESAENAPRQALVGGELLLALSYAAPYAAVQTQLAESPIQPVFAEFFQRDSERPLSEAYPSLLARLVERHIEVSANKNRQPWCYLDGESICRDDLQPMKLAIHAMRFPQLYSLCADLDLRRSDIAQ